MSVKEFSNAKLQTSILSHLGHVMLYILYFMFVNNFLTY